MSLRAPWMLLTVVAVPAVLAAYMAAGRRRQRRAAALADDGLASTNVPALARRARHLPFGLFVAALVVLAVGLARPTATIRTPRREGTVVVAVDVSNSMAATDISRAASRPQRQRQRRSFAAR